MNIEYYQQFLIWTEYFYMLSIYFDMGIVYDAHVIMHIRVGIEVFFIIIKYL